MKRDWINLKETMKNNIFYASTVMVSFLCAAFVYQSNSEYALALMISYLILVFGVKKFVIDLAAKKLEIDNDE